MRDRHEINQGGKPPGEIEPGKIVAHCLVWYGEGRWRPRVEAPYRSLVADDKRRRSEQQVGQEAENADAEKPDHIIGQNLSPLGAGLERRILRIGGVVSDFHLGADGIFLGDRLHLFFVAARDDSIGDPFAGLVVAVRLERVFHQRYENRTPQAKFFHRARGDLSRCARPFEARLAASALAHSHEQKIDRPADRYDAGDEPNQLHHPCPQIPRKPLWQLWFYSRTGPNAACCAADTLGAIFLERAGTIANCG